MAAPHLRQVGPHRVEIYRNFNGGGTGWKRFGHGGGASDVQMVPGLRAGDGLVTIS
ncbi:MAG: hypothetical protein WAM02_01670 [Candidatus Cybelea sp.]